MTALRKIFHVLGGAVIGWAVLWAVFTAIGYLFFLVGISLPIVSFAGIFLGVIEIAIASLPYWFLRRRYPYLANGILVGIGLTVLVMLLLLPFSEL